MGQVSKPRLVPLNVARNPVPDCSQKIARNDSQGLKMKPNLAQNLEHGPDSSTAWPEKPHAPITKRITRSKIADEPNQT